MLTTNHYSDCLSTLHGRPLSQSTIKAIRHAITCDTFIIPYNYDISHSLVRPKTWWRGPKRLKILKNWPIFLFLNIPSYQFRYQMKIKTIRHATINHTLSIFIIFSSYKLQMDKKKRIIRKLENTQGRSLFISLSSPVFRPRLQSKTKAIGDATMCSTFLILCNSNIKHSLTWPNTWGKGPKQLKIIKIEHFS